MTPKVIIAWRKEEQSDDWGACTRHGCSCRHFEGNGELCETCGHFEDRRSWFDVNCCADGGFKTDDHGR